MLHHLRGLLGFTTRALLFSGVCACSGLFAPLPAQSLTPGADAHTVAFWPFDELQYVNMTLTDAGPGQYDLRLRPGGQLVPGRFGNALATTSQSLPACMFAEKPGVLENPDITTRAVEPPANILATLAGPEWTWECWVRLNHMQSTESALLHLTSAGGNLLYVALEPDARAVVLRDWSTAQHVRLPLASPVFADTQWHHLALIKQQAPAAYVLVVDGVRQLASEPITPEEPGVSDGPIEYSQGLVSLDYSEVNLTRPHLIKISPQIDFAHGNFGSSFSQQWRGFVVSPVSGPVTFRADAMWGMRLRVDGAMIIDGWGPSGAREGTVTLEQARKTPIFIEYAQNNHPAPHFSLYWSWPGHAEELVPPEVLFHVPQDAREFGAILGSKPDPLPRAFEMRVGTTVAGFRPLNGCVDELRLSNVVRPLAGNPVPASYTFNYGPHAPQPSEPNGPPLLFASDVKAPSPLPLGGRKHVFIDDALLDRQANLTLTQNKWTRREKINLNLGGDIAAVDVGDEIRLYTTNGDQWNGGMAEAQRAAQYFVTSRDGLTFNQPNLGLFTLNGSTSNSAVVKAPVQGQVFVDTNPATPAAARFKFTAYYMTRGQYLYYSPDGIHFTRNETLMEPFDCGGGVESFWDDQRGEYFSYIRGEGWTGGLIRNPDFAGRASVLARTREPMKPWPFTPSRTPIIGVGQWTMPSLAFELPNLIVRGDRGHVYRARPLKYAWAPDVYLAFVWRGGASGPHNQDGTTYQTDLGVSRDGLHWRYFDPWYIGVGPDFDGETVVSAIAQMGIVRRDDELWNYANLVTRTASGEPGLHSGTYRFAQRLDGYVSLDAGQTTGTATTHPFTFDGKHLRVNLKAPSGQLRFALVNADGSAIPGFALADCVPLTGDSTDAEVTWRGGRVADLAGKPVRMLLELTQAKLFALQFTS